jgi:hypothetical protein
VQSPDFLINLKKNIRAAEKEVKDYEKLLLSLHNEQVKRERRMDKMLGKGAEQVSQQDTATINDST